MKLNPYLKYEELCSKDNFKEFYTLSKNGSVALKKMQKRKLYYTNNDKMVEKENNYLLYKILTKEFLLILL